MDELKKINQIPIFALEGSAFAGKTTLLNYLQEHFSEKVILIPEASEYVGGDKHFPNVPFASLEEAKKSTHFFVEVERQRYRDACRLYQKYKKPVIIDRFTFLSSLFFYRLLAWTKVQSPELVDQFYEHAVRLFSLEVKRKRVALPKAVIFLEPKNREVFEKRLPRGTKNVVFTKWESCQFLNDLYSRFIDDHYSQDKLCFKTENTEENLIGLAEETMKFLSRDLSDVSPGNLLESLSEKEKPMIIDLDVEERACSEIRNRAINLMKAVSLNLEKGKND